MWAGTRRGTTAPLRSLVIFSWDDGVVGKHPRLALQQFVSARCSSVPKNCPRTAAGPHRMRRADPLILLGYSSGTSWSPAIRQHFGPEESTTPISGLVLHRGSLNRHASHVRQHPCQRHPALTHLNHARVQTPKTAPRRRRQTIRRNSRLQLADPCDQCTNRQCCLYTIPDLAQFSAHRRRGS